MFLHGTATGEQVQDDHDNDNQEEEMYPCAEDVEADEANQPEDEENDGDGPKHCDFSCEVRGDDF